MIRRLMIRPPTERSGEFWSLRTFLVKDIANTFTLLLLGTMQNCQH